MIGWHRSRRAGLQAAPFPDLLAESKERDHRAHLDTVAAVLARIEAEEAGGVPADAFAGVPDPYGPDRVVFGPVPRVGLTR